MHCFAFAVKISELRGVTAEDGKSGRRNGEGNRGTEKEISNKTSADSGCHGHETQTTTKFLMCFNNFAIIFCGAQNFFI